MRVVRVREAKTHLSRLIEQAAKGESFIIAKGGTPMVKVVAIDAPSREQRRRLGFMANQFDVPEDFDQMGAAEIARLFRAIE